jgi:hypothetical protein
MYFDENIRHQMGWFGTLNKFESLVFSKKGKYTKQNYLLQIFLTSLVMHDTEI